MTPYRTLLAAALIGCGLSLRPVAAGEPAPVPQSRQEFENALQIVKRSVDAQRDRVQTVQAKLRETDDQIERRISRIVDYVSTVSDSPTSGLRILRAKEDVLRGLKTTVDFYARERDTRLAELCRAHSRVAQEDLIHDITRLNDRIEKRVQQALAITMSLPVEKEVPQILETYYGDAVTRQANPEYTRNKMSASHAAQVRKRVSQALQASVERLQRSNQELERNLSYSRTDANEKFLRDFIERNRDVANQRRNDVMRILTEMRPAGNELAGRAADELVRQVQADRTEAKQDAAEWKRLVNELDLERTRLSAEETRLAGYQRKLDNGSETPAPAATP